MIQLSGFSILLILLSHLVGIKTAANQEEFFVLSDRPAYVVALMDDNLMVLASYDSTTSKLTGTYRIARLAESREWEMQKRRTGKLAAWSGSNAVHPTPERVNPQPDFGSDRHNSLLEKYPLRRVPGRTDATF